MVEHGGKDQDRHITRAVEEIGSQEIQEYTKGVRANEQREMQAASDRLNLPEETTDELGDNFQLGERIRQARKERGLKQKDLAGNDFSPSYVSAIESGKIKPSLGALEKLAERLGKPITYFVARPESVEAATSLEMVELTIEQAKALVAGGKAREALESLESLNIEILDRQYRAMHFFLVGSALIKLERYTEAVEPLHQAHVNAQKNGQRELGERARNKLAVAWYHQGRYNQALELLNHCRQSINKGYITDPDLKLQVFANLAHIHLIQDRPIEAQDLYKEGLQILNDGEKHENLAQALASIYWGLSLAHRDDGELAQARIYALKSLALFDALDNARLILRMRETLGTILSHGNEHEQAEVIFQRMMREAKALGDNAAAAMAYVNLTYLYLKTGDLASATETANQAVTLASACEDKLTLGQAHLRKAQTHAAREEKEEARLHFEKAIALLEEVAASKLLSRAYFDYGEYLKHTGEHQKAIEYLERAFIQKEFSK